MDEYEGLDKFGVENDFEGGQWIDGEFYYRKRKEKPQQTKDDVLYGVFASGSSDSDDYDGSSSSKRRKKKKGGLIEKSSYSKPVSFVSSGTVMPNPEIDHQGKEDEEEKKDEDDKDGYDDDSFTSRLGLGVGSSSGSGLGFSSSSKKVEGRPSKGRNSDREQDEGDEEEEEDSFLPTAFGKMIKEGAEQRRGRLKQAANSKSLTNSAAKRRSALTGSDVGAFERHTKGIGMKLLEKMGYKGGGLGKNEQGIVAPIEAKLRPKKMGMGFNDYEESKNLPTVDSASQRELKEKQQPVVPRKKEEWKKKHAQARNKEYITAEELLAQREERGEGAIPQKILDLRGPQAKVLANLENLNAEEEARDSDLPMPELQHNIRLIVDLAKLEIEELDRKLRNERETVVALHREKEMLQNEATLHKKQLDAMVEITRVLDLTEEENSSGSLTLDSLAMRFGDLQNRFAVDYKLHNLSSIACSYAMPLFIRVFQGWDPLQNPLHGKNLISLWKNLLQGGEEHIDFSGAASPYAQLIMQVVRPAVRISALNTWNPRDPEPMLHFLESWDHLLPPSVRQSILDESVMHILLAAVKSWNPCQETIAIHSWVHPWLPLLGEKLEILYQDIRDKLGNALKAWHPSDESAFTILNPWKTVFDPASWEKLIVKSILPKLHEVMQDFQINPSNQRLDEFNWVKIWASAVPIHHMVNLFEHHFFSKWLQVLYHWLNTNPNFGEVEHWYRGWKSLIPQELLANERIRAQLNMATSMMLQAVEGVQVTQPGMRESISFLRANEQRQFEQQQAAAFAQRQASMGVGGVTQMDGEGEMSLMEVISAYAKEHDLLFMPKANRVLSGHQIYGFGSVSIIIDSVEQKIFALTGEQMSLVTLEQLLQMQNVSGPKRW